MLKEEKKSFRIAIDAMGGDFAPINEIHGAVKLFEKLKDDIDIEVVFVGNKGLITSALSQFDDSKMKYSIVHADEVVTMTDEASVALKQKRNSSMFVGLELHSKGYVDAFVSSGNTGALLTTSTVVLGRIPGVSRPTIGSFFPSTNKYPSLLVDVGANIDTKPRHLFEFAVMGSIYAAQILGLEHPRVGLLNIGEEPSKGTEIVQQTYAMLSESQLNFIGNVEGRDIMQGGADVIVCDGFTGNIVLKFAESVMTTLKTKIKESAKKNVLNMLVFGILGRFMKKMFKDFDYQQYGGLPLLGINGVVIVGHGKSSPLAVQNMVLKAAEFVRRDVNGKIKNALNPVTEVRKTE